MALIDHYSIYALEAGCDEAGRGAFAGPVVAAAVILPAAFSFPLLNDSKQVSPKNRLLLRKIIEEKAVSFGVGFVSPAAIDASNILRAAIKSMHLAIEQLNPLAEFLMIDGNYFLPYLDLPHQCIIKGDSKYSAIAAASILAKTYRDEYMEQQSELYPHYHWKKNKGYGTLQHRKAIETYGLSPLHRKSFKLLPNQPNLNF